MTNRKKCIRNFYRKLSLTIPYKIPGFFDGNLGTWNMQLQKVQKFREFLQEWISICYLLIFLSKIPGIYTLLK